MQSFQVNLGTEHCVLPREEVLEHGPVREEAVHRVLEGGGLVHLDHEVREPGVRVRGHDGEKKNLQGKRELYSIGKCFRRR